MSIINVGVSAKVYNHCYKHKHDCSEIILNFRGEGKMIFEGSEIPFEVGTIVCIPPEIPHTKLSDSGFEDIFIQTTEFPFATNSVHVLSDDESASIQTLMYMAHRVFIKREKNYGAVVLSLFDAIKQLILCRSDNKDTDSDIELFKNKLVSQISNPEFTIADAMTDVAYSTDHFRRRFKAEVGCSPAQYLTKIRMDYAKRLLVGNDMIKHSISEISFMSGFYDQRYFSRVFKAYTGISPNNYKESLN